MKIKVFIKKGYRPLIFLFAASAAALSVVFSGECANGILRGIKMSLTQLVPSMLFIMIIADFIVRSGILSFRGKIFSAVSYALFGVSPQGMSVIVLSLFGGYPVGAKLIASLYERGEISKAESRHLSLFCVCAGTGFLINFLGESLLSCKEIGAIIFLSQVLSVIIMGICMKPFAPKAEYKPKSAPQIRTPFSQMLVESVESGAKVCLSACTAVTAFSGIIGLFEGAVNMGASQLLTGVIVGLLEITTAVSKLHGTVGIEILAFLVGFGGVCVHFQIFSILSKVGISKKAFLLCRLVQGAATAALCALFMEVFAPSAEVFATVSQAPSALYPATVISSAALVATAVLFILTLRRKTVCAE